MTDLTVSGGAPVSASHAAPVYFVVANDEILVGGIALTRLAARVGRTPFYAYDRALVQQRIALLRRVLPKEVHLHYAVKANPMPALVGFIAPQVDGLDVASVGEMQVALDAGVAPRTISFAGPGKTPAELRQAVAAGIVINLESEGELPHLAQASRELGLPAHVAVRVNPDFELKASGMKMGGGPKQFGVDAERVPALLKQIGALGLDFYGFHIFGGSQNLRADAIIDAQQKAVALAIRLAEHASAPVRLLNIGGGFGIPYFPGDKPLDVAAVGEAMRALVPSVRSAFPQAELVVELGRYIVGEAGIYVSRVIDRKVSRGEVFLVTDGGLHHHLSASGNFGQVIRKNYPAAIGNKVHGAPREIASIVGPLCTPLDLLADKMDLAQAQVGDLAVVFQSGAYGLTASPARFLSHPAAAEVLV